jgi:glycosyltransferase involved in cell wall biosynthesis
MEHFAIGFLINSFESGGAQRVFVDDANEFARSGYPVVFYILYGTAGSYPFERELDVRVEKVFLHARGPFDRRAVVRARHLMRTHDIRVLLSTLNDGNIFARWAALGTRRVRLFQREANALSTKTLFQRMLDVLCARVPYRFLAVSTEIEKALVRLLPFSRANVVLLPNGVSLPVLLPRAVHDVPRILAVGRLTEQKDYATLITALAEVARRGRKFSCTCIGDGHLRDALERQAREAGIAERVTFAGALPHEAVCEAYAGADIFVSSSRWEGSPNVLLEAMSYGVAPIATAVGGAKDVLRDGENGLLVPPRDAAALATALDRLLSDTALRARLAAAARERVAETFSREARFSKLQALMQGS